MNQISSTERELPSPKPTSDPRGEPEKNVDLIAGYDSKASVEASEITKKFERVLAEKEDRFRQRDGRERKEGAAPIAKVIPASRQASETTLKFMGFLAAADQLALRYGPGKLSLSDTSLQNQKKPPKLVENYRWASQGPSSVFPRLKGDLMPSDVGLYTFLPLFVVALAGWVLVSLNHETRMIIGFWGFIIGPAFLMTLAGYLWSLRRIVRFYYPNPKGEGVPFMEHLVELFRALPGKDESD